MHTRILCPGPGAGEFPVDHNPFNGSIFHGLDRSILFCILGRLDLKRMRRALSNQSHHGVDFQGKKRL